VANTYVNFTTTSASPLTEFTIPFKFLKAEDIKVRSTRVGIGNTLAWTYIPLVTWNNNFIDGETSYQFGNYSVAEENGIFKIKFSPAVPLAVGASATEQEYSITIYRRTSAVNSTYFSNGSPIQASDLNTILLQSLYNSEEALEAIDAVNAVDLASSLNLKLDKSGGTLTGSLNFANNSISGVSSLSLFSAGGGVTAPRVNLQGGTIQNVPTPAYDTDAVNKSYVDTLSLPGTPITIADDSVTSEKLRKVVGEEAVTTSAIRALAVTNAKLALNAVTAGNIASNAVTNVKILGGAVTGAKLATNAVTSIAINSGAVTEDKIGANAVSNTKLANNAVTGDKILNGTITSAKLASQTLNGYEVLADNTVTYPKLAGSGVSWGAFDFNLNKSTLNLTSGAVSAPNAVLTTASVVSSDIQQKQNLTYLASGGANAGTISVLRGGIKANPSVNISPATLKQFNGSTPVFEFENSPLDPVADVDGYYNFNIYAKSPSLQGAVGAKTLIRYQYRKATNQNGTIGGPPMEFQPYFFYKQVANIPFTTIAYNDNPEISLVGGPTDTLTTTSGQISINSAGRTYLCTLSGFATVIRNTDNAYLHIALLGDTYYDYNSSIFAPKYMKTLAFGNDYPDTQFFGGQSILSDSSAGNYSVKYYYTDRLNNSNTSNAGIRAGFGVGFDLALSSSLDGPAWYSFANLNNYNLSIVDLLIERIK
jgi:hypothetical protein